MATDSIVLGAVAYDPKVVTIWDGFRAWFRDQGLDFDYVLYTNYERQVEDLLDARIDAAWNSPLAWVRTRRLAAARGDTAVAGVMRDTDRDLTSVLVVRADSPVAEPIELRGRIVATGAVDSPQGTLLPLGVLRALGLRPAEDFAVRRFEVGVGLHGDHVGGERAAAQALATGTVDAACMIDANHLLFAREGILPAGTTRIIAATAPYDHCNMTTVASAPAESLARFSDLLLSMDYGDSGLRPLLELEGLKQWLPGRTQGYRQLEHAVDAQGFYDAEGAITADDYRP